MGEWASEEARKNILSSSRQSLPSLGFVHSSNSTETFLTGSIRTAPSRPPLVSALNKPLKSYCHFLVT